MFFLSKNIKILKLVSILLFFFANIALLGTLAAHNSLIKFTLKYPTFPYKDSGSFDILNKTECNANNEFCNKFSYMRSDRLDNCRTYLIDELHINHNGNLFIRQDFDDLYLTENNLILEKYKNEKFFLNIKTLVAENNEKIIDTRCVRNSALYPLYKIFPTVVEKIVNLKNNDPKYVPATSTVVYPFFFGETSISNIAKRYPLNYIFKPFLYVSSILMILYWIKFNNIINYITNSKTTKKINNFFIYGALSSILLFLHVFFLGTEIESNLFDKIRKIIIVLFIFFEVFAQFSLLRVIKKNQQLLKPFIKDIILRCKIYLINFVIAATAVILFILIIFNLTKKFDYFLEWNYFLILLIFYFLSFLIWKKNIRNLICYPSTT